ncbi:hypothetical protein HK101_007846 [Irineochytrium annulatum]|nr:hypothetical protein HK101_007846 [Irineochytrium annulatum]
MENLFVGLIEEATNGQEAVDLVAKLNDRNAYDIIFMDIQVGHLVTVRYDMILTMLPRCR